MKLRIAHPRRLAVVSAIACVAAVTFWWGTAVDDSITPQDRLAFRELATRCGFSATDPIGRIRETQVCVLAQVPVGIIKHGTPREPEDILRAGHGECYDRARVLEKALQIEGFQTRHVFLFNTSSYGVFAVLVKGVPTHALLDVRTARGWMSIDTNDDFLGVTKDGAVVSSVNVKRVSGTKWAYSSPVDLPAESNIGLYGLWSRHGQFFPPYVPLPDISWRDLRYNF